MSATTLRAGSGSDEPVRRSRLLLRPPASHPIIASLARHLVALDVVAAAALMALWFTSVSRAPDDLTVLRAAEYLVAVGATAPLPLRRRWPRSVFAVMAACFALALAMDFASTGVGVALAAYTILAKDTRPAGVAAIVTGYGLIGMANLMSPDATLGNLFFDVITFAMVIAIAELARTRRAYAEIYADRAARLESERAAVTSRALDAERLRIARELHDVVAHSVTSIAVQSSVGLDRLRPDPDAAERALATIETSSRTALAEMRRMLGMLRHHDEISASLTPAPGLDLVDALVSESTAAGIATTLAIEGDRPEFVPPGVDLCGYRIVQEALTNVLKHAPGADASVAITWSPESVGIDVHDDGHGVALFGQASGHQPSGQGLLGMRERVALFGGTLTAGPGPGGGFGVVANLPFNLPRGRDPRGPVPTDASSPT